MFFFNLGEEVGALLEGCRACRPVPDCPCLGAAGEAPSLCILRVEVGEEAWASIQRAAVLVAMVSCLLVGAGALVLTAMADEPFPLEEAALASLL